MFLSCFLYFIFFFFENPILKEYCCFHAHRPILVKLQNLTAKSQIMKKRSDVKKLNKGWKITDDVTKANISLISDLTKDARISSAWYFNGSVYGQHGNRRIKFDIFDDIGQKLKAK